MLQSYSYSHKAIKSEYSCVSRHNINYDDAESEESDFGGSRFSAACGKCRFNPSGLQALDTRAITISGTEGKQSPQHTVEEGCIAC
jgi:hypothetical protein